MDGDNPVVGVDEEHVKRERSVLHPERPRLILVKDKEHALLLGERLAIHKSSFSRRLVLRDLDVEPGKNCSLRVQE